MEDAPRRDLGSERPPRTRRCSIGRNGINSVRSYLDRDLISRGENVEKPGHFPRRTCLRNTYFTILYLREQFEVIHEFEMSRCEILNVYKSHLQRRKGQRGFFFFKLTFKRLH